MAEQLNLAAIDKAVMEHAAVRLEQLRDEIREAINTMGLRASGATQRSLKVTVSSSEVTLWGRRFLAALQYGSQPWSGATGVRCSFAAFVDIVDAWATAKGLNFGQHKEHERVVRAIASTIIRKGSKLYRAHAYRDVYDTLVQEAIKDIGTIAVDEVNTQIDALINQWVRLSTPITI